MDRAGRLVLRFLLVWVIEALSLVTMAYLVPGISLKASNLATTFSAALAAALILGLMNGLVRPFLLWVTLPINVLTIGFSTLFVNAALLLFTGTILPLLDIRDLAAAFLGGLVLSIVNGVLTGLINISENDSFFQNIIERISQRQQIESVNEPGRGIIVLEIDGLSYERVRYAVSHGFMPTLRSMLQTTHQVSHVDCGLPSQTSACQAGILYGDNFDIPAFRWYDKDLGKLLISNHFSDAAELNARYAHGHGLLRGGSSINNLMAGDAEKSLMTLSTLTTADEQERDRRAQDLYLFWLDPYLFTRSFVLSILEFLLELGQGWWQRLRNVQPRINRLWKGYPFFRALTVVFLRDISTYMVALDLVRGVPAIYTTYLGYDEVAHHAGPDSAAALHILRGLDQQIRRVCQVMARKASRPYELFILSDHGQSFGTPFRQRYGQSLTEFIAAHSASPTGVAEATGSGVDSGYAAALVAELQNAEQRVIRRRVRGAPIRGSRRALERQIRRAAPPATMEAPVTVCASGNLAHVYFNLHNGKVSLNEINAAHPELIDALVTHAGLGFVIVYAEDGTPLVLGKQGARNLRTGALTGIDPLAAYPQPSLRAQQLLRMAEFPHAGDLIINSTLYSNGQVAAFEELVGSHGGLGGEQTDAFLIHPNGMSVPETKNSTEIFPVLNARRGLPGMPPLASAQQRRLVKAWARQTWLVGFKRWRRMVSRAARAFRLDPSAYCEVAVDPYATGPALVVVAVSIFIQIVAKAPLAELTANAPAGMTFAVLGLAWLLAVAVVAATCRLLGGRTTFTRTLRVMGFAEVTSAIYLLGLLPQAESVFDAVAVMLRFIALGVGVHAALRLRGWRLLVLPFIAVALFVLAIAIFNFMLSGAMLTLDTIAIDI
ncbi:hypothetical protein TFLX_00879 [Thermoflexales bacterium]|nr:hypothetical protein TFLX_00879 [Thermoflexales bacterium]